MKKLVFYLVALTFFFFDLSGAGAWVRVYGGVDNLEGKKRIEIKDVLEWKRITESALSPNGRYIAAKMEPWKGSAVVKLYDNKGEELFSADSASAIDFDNSSQFFFFKRDCAGKGYMLGILPLKKNNSGSDYGSTVDFVEEVKKHNVPGKADAFLFVHKQDSSFQVIKPGGQQWDIPSQVFIYEVSESGKVLITSQKGAVVKYRFPENTADTLWRGKDEVKYLSLNEDGTLASFVVKEELFMNSQEEGTVSVAEGVSHKQKIMFSPDGTKLYFSFRISLPERDSTISDEDFPEVHIWNWNANTQFTEQVVNKKSDEEAGRLAVYNREKGAFYRIANENVTNAMLVEKGNSSIVITLSDLEYRLEKMWTGRSRYDVYIVDTYLERSMFALKGIDGYPRVSPAGKYLYWYSAPDSSWITYSLDSKEKIHVTLPSVLPVYDMDNDVPDWPSSYYAAGWSEGDEAFLVYDKYDVWRVDPRGSAEPENITGNGSGSKITYRYVSQDKEEEFINLRNNMLLLGFDNKSKGYGYYMLKKPGSAPKSLYEGDFMLSTPVKASDGDEWIFTRETFREFPDIRHANKDFSIVTRITKANEQQKSYIWGTAELVTWTSYDGKELEGVIYKPENYDPSLKYPVIVNFYEKNSSELYSYRTPEAHRSTIDYHLYNSQGYVIFNPDVAYKDGYPGESAYNSVMPGVSKLIEDGIADPERIGAQGHSWGGYQVAYMATRTTLFAAIESGAPVVNMFSAYGGIRWGSGKNRSFQYEHQQSRIGKTPWESPLRYMENSPLFTMDKVETPILIMHNDNDGHVPWYQGIEYFVALKRLRKPAWLLNYTGEVHWPQKLKNKVDFQIRMKQFFDHYLKGSDAPEWMDPGLSVIELKAKTGY